jgi:hypothetical protein
MFWLDVDLAAQTTILHTGDCVHIEPKTTERKGVNEMRVDGGWFSFETIGEAMRFYKVMKLSSEVASCLLCRPLDRLGEVSIAKLDIRTPRTGCDACVSEVEVVDTKSNYRRLLSRLLGKN